MSCVSSPQLQTLLDHVYRGPAPASQVELLLQEFDSNRDGRVSWSEFHDGVKALQGMLPSFPAPPASRSPFLLTC